MLSPKHVPNKLRVGVAPPPSRDHIAGRMVGVAGLTPAFGGSSPHLPPHTLFFEVLSLHSGHPFFAVSTSILALHWEEENEKRSGSILASQDNHLRCSAPQSRIRHANEC